MQCLARISLLYCWGVPTFELYVNVLLELILKLFQLSYSLLFDLCSAFRYYWYLFEMVNCTLAIYLNDLSIVPINVLLTADGLNELGLSWRVSIWIELNAFEKLFLFLHLVFFLHFFHSQLFDEWGIKFLVISTFHSKEPFLVSVFFWSSPAFSVSKKAGRRSHIPILSKLRVVALYSFFGSICHRASCIFSWFTPDLCWHWKEALTWSLVLH